jgi:hypothetical protein
MSKLAVNVIIMLTLPVVVFLLGRWVMSEMSNRQYVMQRLEAAAKDDRKPLNVRLGYDLHAVSRHWAVLKEATLLRAEQRFLELDLIFPFFYGAALATSLLMAWAALGRPFSPAWLIAPVAITVLADWTENLVQLRQLSRYIDGGEAALQSGWIQLASVATVMKLVFFVGSSLFLGGLVLLLLINIGERQP